MNLYILRHASAGTRRANPLLDVPRPLDKEGKQHCLQLAYVLNALKVTFDAVVSSPLKRSVQTAQLVATETGYEARILLSNGLAPEASMADFKQLLQQMGGHENVLMVGHNPNLQGFVGSLLGGSGAEAAPVVRLRKGSLARLSMARGPAVVQLLIDPRTVRALYRSSTKVSKAAVMRKKA